MPDVPANAPSLVAVDRRTDDEKMQERIKALDAPNPVTSKKKQSTKPTQREIMEEEMTPTPPRRTRSD